MGLTSKSHLKLRKEAKNSYKNIIENVDNLSKSENSSS